MYELEKVRVDARGRSCPEPVLLAKKAMADSPPIIEVVVGDITARDNVQRVAKNSGYSVEISREGADYVLVLKR